MTTSPHPEVERKFDLDRDTDLPDLTGTGPVASVGAAAEHALEAVYFDTDDLVLARHRVTLRRRTGGDDAGWHLKLPRGGDARTEVRLPLGRARRTVPKPLREQVRALARDRRLRPVARVSTRRLERALLDEDGTVLAELCDDDVRAERLDAAGEAESVSDWREVEVELVDGDPGLLDVLGDALLAAGAEQARSGSKLARTLGDGLREPVAPPSPRRLARGSAALALQTHLAEHVAALHTEDARVRGDDAEGVHKMRIAARRLRSALTTFRPLLEPGSTDALREELRWLGLALGRARDATVLRERLHALVADQPPDLVLGPVSRRLDAELDESARRGREEALEALASDRYLRLLAALDDLVDAPPLTDAAAEKARDVLPRLLRRDARRLRRAARGVEESTDAHARDLALHETRKKAKRFRYAAEAATPVLGKRARRLAQRAKAVQQALGLHQDAVVARELLRQAAARAHEDGEDTFTYGRLHALEQWRAHEAERDFARAWDDLPARRVDRWVRRS